MKFKFLYLFYFIPIIIFGWLCYKNISSVLELEYKFNKNQPILSQLVPVSRVSENKDSATINSEPVYFDIKLPRKYDKAEVEINYQNLANDIFEIGVAQDETRKSFNFITLENKIFDNFSWEKIEENGLVLYQRKNRYKSINEFLINPPAFEETLAYHAEASPIKAEFLAKGKSIIDFPIKNFIKIITYSDNPEIIVDAVGEYKVNKILINKNLFKIELVGDESTIFNRIEINSLYVAILDKINFGKLQKTQDIYLAGSRFLTKVEKSYGLQEIIIKGLTRPVKESKININELFMPYTQVFANRDIKKISVSKGDIEIEGSIFFLNSKYLFYPRYEVFYGDADLSEVNYILARYVTPKEEYEVKTNTAVFDIKEIPTPYRKLRFLFSLPDSTSGDIVQINSINIRLIGEKFSIKKIFEKIYYTLITNH
ncbi:MAG: hypothetical protein COU51_02475 [Parcubacteria group bacterium CG10_big_fil_rev_8_21_14_0_10_36_14]|nr:MAG: hypothetical protein COU51_02475 [Parcubacteria group bacterium CG10_big_fil_rev_8_21_14_0_10_36_14]